MKVRPGAPAPWVDLAFDGTKPRAVVIMKRDASYTMDKKTAWFVESDDGATWKTPSTSLTTFTVGGPAITTYDGPAKWVSAKVDTAGKVQLVLHDGEPTSQPGLLFYREP